MADRDEDRPRRAAYRGRVRWPEGRAGVGLRLAPLLRRLLLRARRLTPQRPGLAPTLAGLSPLARFRARDRRIWSELDYANRRMFDIRTGAHFMKPKERSPRRATR